MRIVDRGIFLQGNGMWWANSPTKEGYVYSLRTRDKALARDRYDRHLASLREAETKYRREKKL